MNTYEIMERIIKIMIGLIVVLMAATTIGVYLVGFIWIISKIIF